VHPLGLGIVVLHLDDRRFGLVVDEIHDTEEIVIKPLHGQLKRLACYSGATVLGDGGVALILEVAGVAAMAGIDMTTRRAAELVQTSSTRAGGPQQVIVFIAGDGAQCAVPLAMVARLEQIAAQKIERVAGAEVVQYRDVIMPIVRPEEVLALGTPRASADQPLVVFDFGHMVGMAVSSIVDVVNIDLDVNGAEGKSEFSLGRTVILGRTTLLLDVYSIVRRLAPQFVQERRRAVQRPSVLLIDDSSAMRAALGGFLRAAGMDVLDAASGEAALAEIRTPQRRKFDAVITDLEMAGMDGFGVIEAVAREHPELPVFVWTYHDDPDLEARARAAGARACVNKLRREQLVQAMEAEGVLQQRRRSDARNVA
jgi:two-component system chemotaxis sensor kinase CheA